MLVSWKIFKAGFHERKAFVKFCKRFGYSMLKHIREAVSGRPAFAFGFCTSSVVFVQPPK